MTEILYFTKPEEFYAWLEKHHKDHHEMWLGFYKKSTGIASMTWSESVDMALCFGWIDGIRKSVDSDKYKIRFSPRKEKSLWSAVNVKKVEALMASGQMKAPGLRLYKLRSDKEGYTSDKRNVPFLEAYQDQLKAHKDAWTFFNALAPSYKRDSIWWVMSAKRKETQLRRLQVLISSCQASQKIPMLRKK